MSRLLRPPATRENAAKLVGINSVSQFTIVLPPVKKSFNKRQKNFKFFVIS